MVCCRDAGCHAHGGTTSIVPNSQAVASIYEKFTTAPLSAFLGRIREYGWPFSPHQHQHWIIWCMLLFADLLIMSLGHMSGVSRTGVCLSVCLSVSCLALLLAYSCLHHCLSYVLQIYCPVDYNINCCNSFLLCWTFNFLYIQKVKSIKTLNWNC